MRKALLLNLITKLSVSCKKLAALLCFQAFFKRCIVFCKYVAPPFEVWQLRTTFSAVN